MSGNLLRELDYATLQQCIHCGLCLPVCPTYDATKEERNSPRGRIALMRGIADHRLETSPAFADEMGFCLGCLACQTACPAGVDYVELFETSRAEARRAQPDPSPLKQIIRAFTLGWLFQDQRRLRLAGRLMWIFQTLGLQALLRALGLPKLLPASLRAAEAKAPTVQARFSPDVLKEIERPADAPRYRVGLLTGCMQDLLFSDVNRDTADVLLANGCEVLAPHKQGCCGSLHAHNGDPEGARRAARRLLDAFPVDSLDAIITNAGGCGSHLKRYDRLLAEDSAYAEKAALWSRKVRDIHEWLCAIKFRPPMANGSARAVTYHESCHLCHGQKISRQPREILLSIPGLELVELPEATWCCGSAGIYNLTQPAMAGDLAERKLNNIRATGATVVASANPGCTLQIANTAGPQGLPLEVRHPVSLLAAAYRAEALSLGEKI